MEVVINSSLALYTNTLKKWNGYIRIPFQELVFGNAKVPAIERS